MNRPHLCLRGLLWRCTSDTVVGWGSTPQSAYNDWSIRWLRRKYLERRLSRRTAWLFNTLPGAFLVGATLGLLYYLCHG